MIKWICIAILITALAVFTILAAVILVSMTIDGLKEKDEDGKDKFN